MTLFPYTTLFRSQDRFRAVRNAQAEQTGLLRRIGPRPKHHSKSGKQSLNQRHSIRVSLIFKSHKQFLSDSQFASQALQLTDCVFWRISNSDRRSDREKIWVDAISTRAEAIQNIERILV
jgi:hypothetical protein